MNTVGFKMVSDGRKMPGRFAIEQAHSMRSEHSTGGVNLDLFETKGIFLH